jgi:azurin
MAPVPIRTDASGLDLSPRVQRSTTVAASPALAAETVVCSVTLVGDIAVVAGTALIGYVALTVGASGTDVTVKLRRTGTSGTTVVSTGVMNAPAAGDLLAYSISGFDTGTTMPGQVYVLTVTVANGAAESTVSACSLIAIVV